MVAAVKMNKMAGFFVTLFYSTHAHAYERMRRRILKGEARRYLDTSRNYMLNYGSGLSLFEHLLHCNTTSC